MGTACGAGVWQPTISVSRQKFVSAFSRSDYYPRHWCRRHLQGFARQQGLPWTCRQTDSHCPLFFCPLLRRLSPFAPFAPFASFFILLFRFLFSLTEEERNAVRESWKEGTT